MGNKLNNLINCGEKMTFITIYITNKAGIHGSEQTKEFVPNLVVSGFPQLFN